MPAWMEKSWLLSVFRLQWKAEPGKSPGDLMDPPVPGSSHGSEDAPEGGSLRSGQGRPMGQPRTAEVGSLRVERPGQSLE